MLTIVGILVVCGSVLGGFTMAGGHVGALIHPSELVTIGGASLGAMIVMAPLSVLKKMVAGIIGTMKGDPFGKATYSELFKLLYQLFRKARRDGSWHLNHTSPILMRALSSSAIPNLQQPSCHRVHCRCLRSDVGR